MDFDGCFVRNVRQASETGCMGNKPSSQRLLAAIHYCWSCVNTERSLMLATALVTMAAGHNWRHIRHVAVCADHYVSNTHEATFASVVGKGCRADGGPLSAMKCLRGIRV